MIEPRSFLGGKVTLYGGDNRDVLKQLPDNSIDSICTDPPYALVSIQKRFGKPGSAPAAHGKAAYARASAGFMGKSWDTGEVAFSDVFWAECLRVLKPGGHVVAFSGTRTYHRMAVAIEDAGFEIRDQLGWLYGSGFPKSHNQKDEWEGWGTALKPAWEPIALARKPLEGTVAANLARWGVGAINVDGCRVGDEVRYNPPAANANNPDTATGPAKAGGFGMGADSGGTTVTGRWPANIVHDGSDEVLAGFPDAPGQQGDLNGQSKGRKSKGIFGNMPAARQALARTDSTKSAARFFYCAKASRKDRDEGLSAFETKTVDVLAGHRSRRMEEVKRPDGAPPAVGKNTHPTVKPTDLMRWLCRLVTPPGGVVLDPFMGSGSTGKAALIEGFRFIGCEREDEYMPIAEARILAALNPRPVAAKAQPVAPANDNAPDLFSEAAA